MRSPFAFTFRNSPIWTIVITALVTLLLTVLYANFRDPQNELDYRIQNAVAVDDPRFTKQLGDLLDPAFVPGNRIETLLNGDQIFPAMLNAIHQAHRTISFESYIYWSGQTGRTFAEALAERARAGVAVHLLLDWAGSQKIKPELIQMMKDAGVEVERYHRPRWYNITRMNNRTHRKVLVIDGEVGFTGGVGIADEWTGDGRDPKHWRDTHYVVYGPVVNQMQSAFMDNWLKAKPQVYTGDSYFPDLPKAGKATAQMFISSTDEGGSSVRIMYLLAIASARKSIYLQSAYFVPDDHTIEALIAAKRRGVEIHIMVPGPHGDSAVVEHASRELWGDLLREGIHIYRYQPAMFHCKVMVIDRLFSSVGSTNFDQRSFRLNDEANLNILDAKFAEKQIADFKTDQAFSAEITYKEWTYRPWWEKLSGKLTRILHSQL